MSEIRLSEEEKHYLVMGVAQDVRNDGRTRLEYRAGDIEANVVSNSHGSIRIRLAETQVIVAAQVGFDIPEDDEGKITFLVDCSPTASPEFEGRGGSNLSETICSILNSAYINSGSIDLKSLCITPKKHCYVIGVDILVLQCGGNLLDVISMGVKLCLGICEIPKIIGVRSDKGVTTPIMTSDEYSFKFLEVDNAPVVVTMPRIGRYFVVDATSEEESVSKGKLAVGVSPDGQVTSLDKLGSSSYQDKSIGNSVQFATDVGVRLNKLISDKLAILKKKKFQSDDDESNLVDGELRVLNEYIYDPLGAEKFEEEKEKRKLEREKRIRESNIQLMES